MNPDSFCIFIFVQHLELPALSAIHKSNDNEASGSGNRQ